MASNPELNAPGAPAAPQERAIVTPALGRRLASCLYEALLLFGVVFIAGYLFSTLSQTRNALDNRHPLQAFLFVILGIYFTWFWAKGQTLPMKTWQIRVVDPAGRPITQWRALARYFLCWLWFLPPLVVLAPFHVTAVQSAAAMAVWMVIWPLLSFLHPQRQFWHDAWAGTRLIVKPAA
jgi:uncharacterized RDD family membrane protein YckC